MATVAGEVSVAQREDFKSRIIEFVAQASTEVTPGDEEVLAQLPQYLPPGATVYVAHLPKSETRDIVRICAQLVRLGLSPCPHVAARQQQTRRPHAGCWRQPAPRAGGAHGARTCSRLG